MGLKFRNDFFSVFKLSAIKNLSNAMSQSFWKQNAAILDHFEVVPFFSKMRGGGGFLLPINKILYACCPRAQNVCDALKYRSCGDKTSQIGVVLF